MQCQRADESNKQNILEVAERLFATKGYDGTGVQEIAFESGVTKPTLYYYYDSKIGILDALIKTKGFDFLEKIKIATNYSGDFFKSLQNTLKAFVEMANADNFFLRLHCSLANAPEDSEAYKKYKIIFEKLSKMMLDLFVSARDVFGNIRGKEELYSKLFLYSATSVATYATNDLNKKVDDDAIYQIVHSFLYGIAT